MSSTACPAGTLRRPLGWWPAAAEAAIRSRAGYWLAVALVAALVLSPLAFMPLARDQSLFAYSGQVILAGGAPYRDVFEQKGPATHYLFAALVALGGNSQLAIRGFFYLVLVGSVLLGAGFARRVAGPSAGFAAAVAASCALLQGDWGASWQTGQIEDLLLFLSWAALAVALEPALLARGWRPWAWGMLWGLAVALKPTAVLPAALMTLVLTWYTARRTGWPSAAAFLVRATLGGALPVALVLAAVFHQGAWPWFWEQVVQHNMLVYAKAYRRPWQAVVMLLDPRWSRLEMLALLALGYCRIRDSWTWQLLGWLLLGHYGAVVWQGKFWPYHWTPAVATLAVVAGVGIDRMVRLVFRASRWRHWPIATGALLGLLGLLAGTVDVPSLVRTAQQMRLFVFGHGNMELFRALYPVGAASYQSTRPAADYLAEHTPPGEAIQVWGHECLLYFLSGRRAASRFAVNRPLCQRKNPRMKQWRREFLRQMEQSPPYYFVVVHQDGVPQFPRGSDRELARFPALKAWLRRNYRLERRFEYFSLYRRLPAPRSGHFGRNGEE